MRSGSAVSSARAAFHVPEFAAVQSNLSQVIAQLHFAFEQGEEGEAVLPRLQLEFGAADRSAGRRGAEFDIGRFFAAEKVNRAVLQIEQRLLSAVRGGEKLQRGQLTDAQHALIGEPHHGAAVLARSEAIAPVQIFIDPGPVPIQGAGQRNLHRFAFGRQDLTRRHGGHTAVGWPCAAQDPAPKTKPTRTLSRNLRCKRKPRRRVQIPNGWIT